MRRVVITAFAALIFLPVAMKSRKSRDVPVLAAFHPSSSSGVCVKVSGDVVHPGIYCVSANELAISVIKMAEPLRPLRRYENCAAAAGPLPNGSAVRLSTLPDGSPLLTLERITVAERVVLGIPLEISAMGEADFDRLPGIGPALARRIVEYRQNNGGVLRVEDLAAIEGIGEKKYKKILPYFQLPANTE